MFHELTATADALHSGPLAVTAGQRGVMESLLREGPQTVPALARSRPVSRQHIQMLVNALTEAGWVEAQPNPAHRRSALIGLSPAGHAKITAMLEHEREFLHTLGLPVTIAEMKAATETLTRVRAHLARARATSDLG